jgi:hypothetical protein
VTSRLDAVGQRRDALTSARRCATATVVTVDDSSTRYVDLDLGCFDRIDHKGRVLNRPAVQGLCRCELSLERVA